MKEISSSRKIKYKSAYQKFGSGIKSLYWKDFISASKRHKAITENLDFNQKSILDIGCGFGDILPYIAKDSHTFQYLGIDIVEEFILEAKKRFPGKNIRFNTEDFFAEKTDKKYDIVICSGSLNSNFNEVDNLEYRKKAIAKMFDSANEVLAFNMAGQYSVSKIKNNQQIYYADSLEILKFCFSLTHKIVFKQNYHRHDFAVIMYK